MLVIRKNLRRRDVFQLILAEMATVCTDTSKMPRGRYKDLSYGHRTSQGIHRHSCDQK